MARRRSACLPLPAAVGTRRRPEILDKYINLLNLTLEPMEAPDGAILKQ